MRIYSLSEVRLAYILVVQNKLEGCWIDGEWSNQSISNVIDRLDLRDGFYKVSNGFAVRCLDRKEWTQDFHVAWQEQIAHGCIEEELLTHPLDGGLSDPAEIVGIRKDTVTEFLPIDSHAVRIEQSCYINRIGLTDKDVWLMKEEFLEIGKRMGWL